MSGVLTSPGAAAEEAMFLSSKMVQQNYGSSMNAHAQEAACLEINKQRKHVS